MDRDSSEQQVQRAILDFTMGDYPSAMEKLDAVLAVDPDYFDALLAKTEVHYAMEQYDAARHSAEAAEAVRAEDVHLKTSLSRIWMQIGDKERAEKYGAEAKMLSWKEELLHPPSPDTLQN